MTPSEKIESGKYLAKYLSLLILLCVTISFYRLGSATLFDVDEAVFAEATKEMVESGDWMTPTYNGENRYDKPILFYWLMAVSYKAFGISEFSARLPSAAAGVLTGLIIFLFVRQFHDERRAFYASLSFVLSLSFLIYSHAAVTDMALSLLIAVSLFSFYLSLKKDSRYIYGFYIFSALAFLTKGLIGIIFPLGIAVVYLFMTEGFRGIRKAFVPSAIIVFLIISLPWNIAQITINGREFIQNFFVKHHFMRYTGVISGHKGPVFYYIPVLIAGLFPWIGFLPAGIRNIFKNGVSVKRLKECDGALCDNLGLFACIWLGFIFLFFSFSTTKLPNYILPAMPSAAILISGGMYGGEASSRNRKLWKILFSGETSNVIIIVLSLAVGAAFIMSRTYLAKKGIPDIHWMTILALPMFAMGGLNIVALFTKRRLYGLMSVTVIFFLFLLSIRAVPVVNSYLQGTLYKYSLYAKERLGRDEKIIAYGLNNPSIVFYSGHKIIDTRSKETLSAYIQRRKDLVAIIKRKDVDFLKNLGFDLVEQNERYALLERK